MTQFEQVEEQVEEQVVTCAAHPDTPSNLRCSKCDKAICPRCLVQTPVGARCADCAQLKKLPIFQVGARHYAKAIAVAVGVGILAGLIWGVLPFRGFFVIIISGAIGYAVGEAVSLITNRRRSLGLKAVAVFGVAVAYVVGLMGVGFILFAASALTGTPGPFFALVLAAAANVLASPIAWLAIAAGGFMAVNRIG